MGVFWTGSWSGMGSLERLLEEATGRRWEVLRDEPVGGGCIHDARRVRTPDGDVFVKRVPVEGSALLETEAAGLDALRSTGTVRVPAVVACGCGAGEAVLVLEWIDLQPLDHRSGETLGGQMAALHAAPQPSSYGWERDNFIGSTPQENGPMEDWVDFFRVRRLAPQLRRAGEGGFSLPPADPFLERMEVFFPSGAPPVSALHGDLWGGNAAVDAEGGPVLFDPAYYRGDAEADIAFTRFFGGFPDSFYRAYREAVEPRGGSQTRETLYNLYHVLNHLNLFGASYLGQARRMIEDLNDRARAH